MMVSAVVLTRSSKNNSNLKRCLESLKWCGEVIILEKLGLSDYASQRNQGLSKAKNDWVLFVDDDEVVSMELSQEIQKIDHAYDGYFVQRKDFLFGKKLNFGETGNIRLLRLGNKSAGSWKRKVHEYWDIKNAGDLKNPLYHYPHQTIKAFIDSINAYTTLDAPELLKEGKAYQTFRLIANPVGKFFNNFILKLGFLDGETGFVVAFMMSLHSLIARIKQYELTL